VNRTPSPPLRPHPSSVYILSDVIYGCSLICVREGYNNTPEIVQLFNELYTIVFITEAPKKRQFYTKEHFSVLSYKKSIHFILKTWRTEEKLNVYSVCHDIFQRVYIFYK